GASWAMRIETPRCGGHRSRPARRRLMTDRRREPAPPEQESREGEHESARLGPVPITVTGVLIAVALVGSLAYLAYAVTVRDASQIPLLASGAVVLGIVFAVIAA